jgi:hypothetical protein
MDKLPLKITFHPSNLHCWDRLDDVCLDEALAPLELVAASSCGPEKSYTLPDHAHQYDGSRTTSLHLQGGGMTSSPSVLWVPTDGSHDLRDPFDMHDRSC